ncbi:hypothetical protein AWB68_06558 [Caballeronia choica]|uniref:Uncharacterized protein n=1 Tax=Caballeronia choica TaxID=326476 RepID=A0A158KN20_9BURK|nr:hypothetical protein [Caballeronia choica]SAL82536.1 hypothetical protein AWB68_06558 [Caballeronia choica]
MVDTNHATYAQPRLRLLLNTTQHISLEDDRVAYRPMVHAPLIWRVLLAEVEATNLIAFGYLREKPTDSELGEWLFRALALHDDFHADRKLMQVIVPASICAEYPSVAEKIQVTGKTLVRPHEGSDTGVGRAILADHTLGDFISYVADRNMPPVRPSELWLFGHVAPLLGASGKDPLIRSFLEARFALIHAYVSRVDTSAAKQELERQQMRLKASIVELRP